MATVTEDKDLRFQAIENLAIFRALPENEKEFLCEALKYRKIPAGDFLCREGEPGDRMFFLRKGEVEVIKALGTPDERLFAVHGPGDFLGEMSLLDPEGVRSASVRARSEISFFELTRQDFMDLLERRPSLSIEMVRELSDRLRDTDEAAVNDLREKNRQLTIAYEELKAAQAQIVEKEKMEHELQMARDIQRSILPSIDFDFPDFEFGARMSPARTVGGDLYDMVQLNEDLIGISLGDVSDKGVPSALFMAVFSSYLRAEASELLSPVEVLRKVNDHLMRLGHMSKFVTVIYGLLDRKARRFAYARAGHEVPIYMDAKGQIHKLPWEIGQPICMFANPAIDAQELELPKGSRLLLYTDGATDAKNESNELYGFDRLESFICDHRTLSAQELCDQLTADIQAFQAPTPQFDDITLVAINSV